ncbi:type VI secretion system baseplate subunit TssE [Providencia vermicola]|uniref:Type VI secretion system baseplate subunit TssE n=2 Tax=Providencia TaxID=586 RepID=A0AAI9MV87_PROST|nr:MULTISPECIES: type VI secretion system baseplate subunit TssE [Providencia]ELR5045731.1 type VI secretion system baseplate subunit TssE [Providencia rettgeri]ELR5035528.1 type VI secretion system baseplate subunit TssE [Providencia stuartii]ELR5120524.1 type VI secretion system baseplate subunit TssE [Providencia stuartii]ELR5143063.1 type VI secretion system baseplate subunit TssE [Providencia stuartii]ELR5291881.1 type VI secretion system baseplate subunit TssE [Providencia stuartii]
MSQPSLYEMLTGYFAGGLMIDDIPEHDQVILSVMDNIRRILNARAGSIEHLPDYGLPDMSKLIQGLPGTAHNMMNLLSKTLLKYEPRIKSLSLVLLPQNSFGTLRYALEVELYEKGLIRYGTEFVPDGRILLHHLKKQFDTI